MRLLQTLRLEWLVIPLTELVESLFTFTMVAVTRAGAALMLLAVGGCLWIVATSLGVLWIVPALVFWPLLPIAPILAVVTTGDWFSPVVIYGCALAGGVLLSFGHESNGGAEIGQSSLWLHQLRVRRASSPEEVETLRRKYSNAIGLPRILWRLREDLGRDGVVEIQGTKDILAAGLNPLASPTNLPFEIYEFSVESQAYALCTKDRATGVSGEVRGVWVVEKPSRVVLSMRFPFERHGNEKHWFEESSLDAFKPGPWLTRLCDIANRVQRERRDATERMHQQWEGEQRHEERERARKNFLE